MPGSVEILAPKNYNHARGFEEIACSFQDAFDELKIEKSLVFGAHIDCETSKLLLKDDIIYQTEQVFRDSSWMTENYLSALKTHEVWDYSLKNIQALAKMGVEAKHVPIGYMPSMTMFCPYENQDLDILLVGSMNDRRAHIIKQLWRHRLNVHHAFDVYGKDRDELIARSKIVINVHYYETAIFEIFRCSHLMANQTCIVSEVGSDEELEEPFIQAIPLCDYGLIAEECARLIKNPQERKEIAQDAFEAFSSRTQTQILKEIL